MFKALGLLLIALMGVTLFACEKERDPREENRYNVVMRHKGKKGSMVKPMQKYVGTVKGLSACEYHGKKHLKNPQVAKEWEVICCWYAGNNKCKEEHKPGPVGSSLSK